MAACLLPASSWADDQAAQIRAIVDSAIRPVMAEFDVPGMAVAVTIGGQPVFINYGLASREQNTPVTENTLFELGSISKTFTGTLGAYAQAQGKLSFDEHPGKYLHDLKGSAVDKASLLHLATYTAGGLPLQFPDKFDSRNQETAYFKQWKPDAAPGVQRNYSNPSIGLFGHAVAAALKSDYADAMEKQLLPKLGLRSTYIHVPDAAKASYAWGYNKDNKPVRVNPGAFDAEAYGIKSTAADMIRYLQANIDPSQLDAAARRAVDGTHVGYFEAGAMVQGLGWEQYPYPVSLERLLDGNSSAMVREAKPVKRIASPAVAPAMTLFNKTGSTGGFGAYALFVPGKKIGIVMLANKVYPNPARIKAAHAILEQLAPMAK
ncbi:class C beta-lactamase [Pseudoduganella violacea]|nr:class C beta-lactamase [Pseudoduganella violacea]